MNERNSPTNITLMLSPRERSHATQVTTARTWQNPLHAMLESVSEYIVADAASKWQVKAAVIMAYVKNCDRITLRPKESHFHWTLRGQERHTFMWECSDFVSKATMLAILTAHIMPGISWLKMSASFSSTSCCKIELRERSCGLSKISHISYRGHRNASTRV